MDGTASAPNHRLARPEPEQRDIDEFRRLSSEAATAVAVVSTVWQGRDYAGTVGSFLTVSWDPPTLLASLYAESRLAAAVAGSGRWALSVLAYGQKGTANWLASPGTPLEGLLARVPFQRGVETGAAVIDGSLAHFELETSAIHTAATHLLVVGMVLGMGSSADAAAKEAVDPLLHWAGSYARLRP
ncbi:flavin reductase family protein [Arthrobacter sp. 35W]|uniref:flavin reductase family protein n=1 Tax=Arthrobacter sp. 35W TaxID=1132441 RepID=UPI00041C412B|nr:flavin reductase family protein [Arthrobacter sp. 35W]